MKQYYAVTYRVASNLYCTNLALAASEPAVENHFMTKYPEVVQVRKVPNWEVVSNLKKGMPVVEIDTPRTKAPLAQQIFGASDRRDQQSPQGREVLSKITVPQAGIE